MMADHAKHADRTLPKLAGGLVAFLVRLVAFLVPAGLCFGGILFALWGLTISGAPLGSMNFLFGSLATEGTVVKVEDSGEGHWRPVVEYDVDGKSHTLRGWAGSAKRSHWTVGQRVPVLYMKDRTSLAQIDSFFDRWYYPLAIMVLGVSLFAGGATLYAVTRYWMRECFARTPPDGELSPSGVPPPRWQWLWAVAAGVLMTSAGALCVALGVATCVLYNSWLPMLPCGGFGLMFVLIGVATLRYQGRPTRAPRPTGGRIPVSRCSTSLGRPPAAEL
jgi:hypothetical protein